jgi:hypothetical protein
MTRNEVYPSRWLKASDLSEDGEQVTNSKVSIEPVGEEREEKPVMTFDELEKELVVNVTNWNAVADITGEEDSDHWIGSRIKLIKAKVPFGTKQVEAIRVEAADKKPKLARRAATPARKEPVGEFADPY